MERRERESLPTGRSKSDDIIDPVERPLSAAPSSVYTPPSTLNPRAAHALPRMSSSTPALRVLYSLAVPPTRRTSSAAALFARTYLARSSAPAGIASQSRSALCRATSSHPAGNTCRLTPAAHGSSPTSMRAPCHDGCRTTSVNPAASRRGTYACSSPGSATVTSMSMMGLASRPGTDVDPTWSMVVTCTSMASSTRSATARYMVGQAALYGSTMRGRAGMGLTTSIVDGVKPCGAVGFGRADSCGMAVMRAICAGRAGVLACWRAGVLACWRAGVLAVLLYLEVQPS